MLPDASSAGQGLDGDAVGTLGLVGVAIGVSHGQEVNPTVSEARYWRAWHRRGQPSNLVGHALTGGVEAAKLRGGYGAKHGQGGGQVGVVATRRNARSGCSARTGSHT
jgi:hypothetical protein